VSGGSHHDLVALLDRGPDPDSPTGYGICARVLRRIVMRALRHTQDYQRRVDQLLLAQLGSLERLSEGDHDALAGLLSRLDALTTTLERESADVRLCHRRITELSAVIDDVARQHRDRSLCLDNLAFDITANGGEWDERENGDQRLQARLDTWRTTLRQRLRQDGAPSRRVVVPASVRLDTEVGSLLYPAHDEVVTPWVAVHHYWEREETSLLESRLGPGMRFIDVGAHVGYLTFAAARAVGPSGYGISLEPAPENFALLYANLIQAGVSNVEPINAAAWRKSGYVDLELSTQNSGDHRVVEREGSGDAAVLAVALDDILPPDACIDVVKIDTQGRDHVAVEGMSDMIGRSRPLLLVEFWPEGIADLGDQAEAVLDFYRSLDLRIEVLGAPDVDGTSNAMLIDSALGGPGFFCTLVLTPNEKPPTG
jgi:FkbM family methyltransferase